MIMATILGITSPLNPSSFLVLEPHKYLLADLVKCCNGVTGLPLDSTDIAEITSMLTAPMKGATQQLHTGCKQGAVLSVYFSAACKQAKISLLAKPPRNGTIRTKVDASTSFVEGRSTQLDTVS